MQSTLDVLLKTNDDAAISRRYHFLHSPSVLPQTRVILMIPMSSYSPRVLFLDLPCLTEVIVLPSHSITGTYCRWTCINAMLTSFLNNDHAHPVRQIVSLGAGYDTRMFYLSLVRD
jgi:hypothetical protein